METRVTTTRAPERPARWMRLTLPLVFASFTATLVRAQSACAKSDSAANVTIRQRLLAWVEAANRGDFATTREIWAPGLVGWFPNAPMFGDSAAYAAAGLPYDRSLGGAAATYELVIEEVTSSGPLAAVHDVWTETRRLRGAAVPVRRVIRSSELWRCHPDGQWRIARFVSAPEPWTPVR